jgi:integrase
VQQIDVFTIQDRRSHGKPKPWVARWRVEGQQRSRAFRTRAEAERYRSLLVHAVTSGQRFDRATGEPASWSATVDDPTLHQWVRRWLAEQWPEWQPRTRTSVIEAIVRFVPLVVRLDAPPPPPPLRSYLRAALVPEHPVNAGHECEQWLERYSVKLGDLDKQLLARVEGQLAVADNGEPLGPATAGRFRKVARACIRRAVQLDFLDADPWPPAPLGRSARKSARLRRAVDVRALPDPTTMQRIIGAIATQQPASKTYQLMTAVVYYAGLRPSEVVMLRRRCVSLPEEADAWGRIDVLEADIDNGVPGDPKTGPRSVPIPPALVVMLQGWVQAHAPEPGDLLFRTRTGRRPASSNWTRAWHRALRSVDAPRWRIYDCRHAAATTWLASGAPLGEVARRLGHTVDTLVSTYVGALTGDEQLTNARIAAALQPVELPDKAA